MMYEVHLGSPQLLPKYLVHGLWSGLIYGFG